MAVTGPMEPELAPWLCSEKGRGWKRPAGEGCPTPSQTTALGESKLFCFFFWGGGDNAFNSRGRGKPRHRGQTAVCLPKVPLRLGAGSWYSHGHSILCRLSLLILHIFKRLSLRKKYCSAHLGRRDLQPGSPGPWLSGLEGASLLED